MAMKILNNSSSISALNQLNQNNSQLTKTLAKVSSGQKINSAKDDASAYGISEQIRVRIRALDQDQQNVQNGSAMLKTAHGGIQEIIDELRSLKELAINAANDSNSDADRVILHRDLEKKRDNIDDIATFTNFNTKPLLDGTYSNSKLKYSSSNSWLDLASSFTPGSPNCIQVNVTETGYGHDILPIISFLGDGYQWSGSPLSNIPWAEGDYPHAADIAIKMNFTSINSGFSILCEDCEQYINLKFDYSLNNSDSFRSRNPAGGTDDSGESEVTYSVTDPISYTIGIAGISDAGDLAKAIFEGIKAIDSNENEGQYTFTSGGAEIVMMDTHHTVNVMSMSGEYYITKESTPELCIYDGLIDDDSDEGISYNTALTIHHGDRSNQFTNFFINDMHSTSLGIDRANLTTRSNATSAISIIDNAIGYALNEVTNVGAFLQRLDFTESNIVTSSENSQGTESTIRDADMAKEMTEYTKSNVLSQAAQSMLAQANQSLSGVLSLLQ